MSQLLSIDTKATEVKFCFRTCDSRDIFHLFHQPWRPT